MLALATRPHGPSRMNPPPKSMPGSGCPCASCGVWQSVHPAVVTRYFPRFSGVERSGSGTGASSGSGTLRIRYFTGKISSVVGHCLRTGGSDRKYTTIDARSSSDRARKSGYGMNGNSARPSWPTPSRMARASWSSLQLPTPVSASGVIFGAYTFPGKPLRMFISWPAPSEFGRTGASCAVQSCPAWQSMQSLTSRTRYSPRARRAGVLSNFRAVSARARGLAVDLPRREPTRRRPDNRPPADGERDSRRQNDRQRGEHPPQNFPESFHLIRNFLLDLENGTIVPRSEERRVGK